MVAWREIPPSVACSHCTQQVVVPDETPPDFFQPGGGVCPHCSRIMDWWASILGYIQLNPPFVELLTPVGVRQSVGQITLVPGSVTELTFSECGVPPGSRILYLNYTPLGPSRTIPIELHGNTPPRRVPQNSVQLYPYTHSGQTPTETQVWVMIAWVPESKESAAWNHLVDAFDAVRDDRYSEAIIPANVAVEASLYGVLIEALGRSTSPGQAKMLLGAATYYHQLNGLLPHLAAVVGAPPLRGEIVDGLNRLLELLNQLAHQGRLQRGDLAAADVIELICSALFGFRYMQFVEPFLVGLQK